MALRYEGFEVDAAGTGAEALAKVRDTRPHVLLLDAYSPFAHGYVHHDPVLAEIGARHGKSAGQVALRWLLDQPNVAAIPKASSHARRAENLDVFDFALDDDERAAVAALSRRHLRTADPEWAPDWD